MTRPKENRYDLVLNRTGCLNHGPQFCTLSRCASRYTARPLSIAGKGRVKSWSGVAIARKRFPMIISTWPSPESNRLKGWPWVLKFSKCARHYTTRSYKTPQRRLAKSSGVESYRTTFVPRRISMPSSSNLQNVRIRRVILGYIVKAASRQVTEEVVLKHSGHREYLADIARM